jgi:hypothetical protein
MAPLVKGDFLEYSGFRAPDGRIVCWEVVATNIQLKTTGAVTYIRMEDAIIGVFTNDPNAEQGQSRVSSWKPLS